MAPSRASPAASPYSEPAFTPSARTASTGAGSAGAGAGSAGAGAGSASAGSPSPGAGEHRLEYAGPVIELVVQVEGGADQGQVAERLREVTQLLAGLADLLGVQ